MHARKHTQADGRGARRGTRGASRARRGFTLIETALATVIVGTGVLAIVAAQQAFFRQNEWSTHASTAQRLGNEIRELTLHMPRHDPVTGTTYWGPESTELDVADFDDLDDFDGEQGDGTVVSAALGNGPISALGDPIPDMTGWSQRVFVEHIDPFEVTRVVADGASDVVRVRVIIEYQGPTEDEPREITRVTWIAPG
jgi:prepilin-type N-terminal cleavage/methylation domain-containing protein